MISYPNALARTLEAARPTETETAPIASALHRVLAMDVASDAPMPPFNRVAMDGFACRRADLPQPLLVIEEVAAGRMPTKPIGPGQCARIMTGAPLPSGADCVVMVEQTEITADGRMRFTGETTADNYAVRGEDLREGAVVLKAGTYIRPAHLAVLAAVGCTNIPVARIPSVAVLATGDELTTPSETPVGAQIRNSNTPQLLAQLSEMGIAGTDLGIVGDSVDATGAAVRSAMETHDVTVLTGGVSMGAYDFVPGVLKDIGFSLLYERVAMQPGKPTVFGRTDAGCYCFALPGNPVSSFTVFELLLKPFLYKLQGHAYAPRIISAILSKGFHRKKADRQLSLPVRFVAADTVELLPYHGSGHLHALCAADGLITLAPGRAELKEGSTVDVRCL